ncbi:MAG: phage minor head protein, partial [Bilophila sp.]
LEGGYTFPQFKKKLIPALKKAHWWRERAKAGDDERTLFQNGILQLETIFHANMRISFAQGRWEQQQEGKDTFPYLRYEGILDSRIRPQHRNWHGVILPIDHPWWKTHYPPNGWKCRCAVLSISDDDLERFGWQVSETPVDEGAVTWVNSLTDEVLEVPDGIDPGWACHSGAASPSVPF